MDRLGWWPPSSFAVVDTSDLWPMAAPPSGVCSYPAVNQPIWLIPECSAAVGSLAFYSSTGILAADLVSSDETLRQMRRRFEPEGISGSARVSRRTLTGLAA